METTEMTDRKLIEVVHGAVSGARLIGTTTRARERLAAELRLGGVDPNVTVGRISEALALLDKVQALPQGHRIQLGDDGWIIQHPAHEAIDGVLLNCTAKWDQDDLGLRGTFELNYDDRYGEWILGAEVK